MSIQLTRYDAACRAIAQAKSVDEVKDIRDKAVALRAYARQAKNRQLEIDAAEIRWRAERRLGEMIRVQKENGGMAKGGRPLKTPAKKVGVSPTLADAGIDHKLSARSQRLASMPEEKFEADMAKWRGKAMSEDGNTIAAKWTGDQESYTPAKYIEAARAVMGGIDLDPASNALAQKVVKAARWHDKQENGLMQKWRGRVFLNPPYSHPEIAQFMDKLVEEIEAERVTTAILLTNNNTDTKWWHLAAKSAAAVCFTAGRINFYKTDGTITQPTNGQTFFYFGSDTAAFRKHFAALGLIMTVAGD